MSTASRSFGPLARLAARRLCPPALLVCAALLLAFACSRSWTPEQAAIEALPGAADPAAIARALTRQGIWTLALVLLGPALVARAALLPRRWQRGEADWLGSRALGRGPILLATWTGQWLAAGALLLATAAVAELAAGGDARGLRDAGPLPGPELSLVDGEGIASWRVEDPGLPAGSAARLELLPAPGSGPAASVRVELWREPRPAQSGLALERRISARTPLLLELPEGPGDLIFRVRREDQGAVIVLPAEGQRLLRPSSSERWASLGILSRAWLALGALLAAALGLGAWLSGPTAALGVLALWLLASYASTRLGAGWLPLPGADLLAALESVGRGVIPASRSVASLAALAPWALVGLGLAALGLRDWRRA